MMKRLIRKVASFLLVYLIIGQIIFLFIPYHWGNPVISSKIRYLEKINENRLPNTYFWGSSRVYWQINPHLFDSIYNNSLNVDIHSFNMGAPATFSPQTYFLYRNFLSSVASQKTKYVFMELTNTGNISEDLMHQESTTYWQNFHDLIFVFKSLINDPIKNNFTEMEWFTKYVVSYIENIFHIGHFGQQLVGDGYYNQNYLGKNKDGFFPIEDQFKTVQDEKSISFLKERRILFKNDSSILQNMISSSIKIHKNKSNLYNQINLNKVLELIEISKQKNIHLIFVLSPKNISKDIIKLASLIPSGNIIDFSSAEKFPELYSFKTSFDKGHLNTEGTIIYTSLLCKEFIKIIDSKKK